MSKVGFNLDFLESYLKEAGFIDLEIVDGFGIFKDTSIMRFKGCSISLNIVAKKPDTR